MEVINSSSGWNFWDLFRDIIRRLKNCKSEFEYERAIIRLLEKLPNGDYSNIRKEWDKRE